MIRRITHLGFTGSGRWTRRLALALGVPIVLLFMAERVLRLLGFGAPGDFLVPGADGTGFVPNESFGQPYHCPEKPAPFSLPDRKPADTAWVFVLGESAAHGSPDPAFGPARTLEILLQDRFPGKRVQVFNAAMMGINSFAVERIARDCAAHEADLLIVYAGNNELIGSFGVHHFANRFPPAIAQRLIRGVIAARSSSVGQALLHVFAPPGPRNPQDEAFFLAHRIAPDDPRRETVRENFATNLRAIASLARTNGPQVLFSTVAVNLRDWSPLASLGTNDQSALAHFLSAQEATRRNDRQNALREFQEACRCDALPFRTDPTFNRTIRETAVTNSATAFVDAESLLSANEIPGDRWFVDHVHFSFAGSCALARLWFDPAARALTPRLGPPATHVRVASDDELAMALAYTPWDELKLSAVMLNVLARPPCSLQTDAQGRLARERVRHEEDLRRFDAATRRRCVRTYEDALTRRPDDVALMQNFIELLDGIDQPAAALPYAAALVTRHPQHEIYANIQRHLQSRADQFPEMHSPLGQFHFEQGTVLLAGGNAGEAVIELRRSLACDEHVAQTHNNLGAALLRTGATNEAIAEFERTVELMPGHAGAHLNLGLTYAGCRQEQEAVEHLRRAIALNVSSHMAATRLAWFLATSERDDIRNGREAVELAEAACRATHRKDPAALASLVAAYAEYGRFDDAMTAFEEQTALRCNAGNTIDDEEARRIRKHLQEKRPIRHP